jgi:hypothetical protein
VRNGKANVRVANQDGTAVGGSGSIDLFWLAILLVLASARLIIAGRRTLLRNDVHPS